jgi:cytochrome c oxidase subunit 3
MADPHAAPKHDYHLVNPSIWPLFCSAASVVMMVGAVAWMKGVFGLPQGTHWLFFTGLLLTVGGMGLWWADVVKEANAGDHTPVVAIGLRYGMVLFIASEIMFFAAFFWMFFEMSLFDQARTHIPEVGAWADTAKAWSTWPPKGVETLDAWHLPLLNTVTLLLSGTTVTWAHQAIIEGDRKGAKFALILTIALGAFFTCIQAYEYIEILHENLFFNEEAANSGLYGSIFFMATGFHGFHVLVGTIFLAVCLFRLLGGAFTPKQHFGFEAAAWYWHFVDVVWLFLFAFVYVAFG